ncbi:hypothetical protein JR338_10500 [Chloroflexota bacterium]|nr:hypothetical protein JR338_10500 [Chloroflexota bacterium]
MDFLKGFLKNLLLIFVLFLVVYFMYPEVVKQMLEAYWLILGPMALIFVIVAALPKKRTKRSD